MRTWKNKYSNYSVQDFLLDDTFIDWVRLGKNPDHIWTVRLSENEGLSAVSRQAEEIITNLVEASTTPEDEQRIHSLKARIDSKIKANGIKAEFGTYEKQDTKQTYWRFAVAAAVLLVLVAGYSLLELNGFQNQPDKVAVAEEVRTTKNGQKLMVHLNDGSKVRLNSGSEIRYHKYFSDTSRVIVLEGEAFFEVAKDALRPFRVISGGTVTEALGTSFNVRSRENEEAEIALVTGNVVVSSTLNDQRVILNPGNKVRGIAGELGSVTQYEFGDVAWKDDILFFSKCGDQEVFERLENWYGVKFRFDGTFNQDWSYSGQFDNQSLYAVLTSIGHTEGFTFSIENKEVVIKTNPDMK